VAQAILTALPISVIAELGNPNSRSSLASAIKVGKTPGWFVSLDPAIRSYIESVRTRYHRLQYYSDPNLLRGSWPDCCCLDGQQIIRGGFGSVGGAVHS
jgi:hypothetical protein